MIYGKRFAAAIAALCLTLSATGCGGGEEASVSYTWGNVAIGGGGYITGIVYNPGEEGLCYVRTDIGGAYRRDSKTDGTWVPLTDEFGGYNGSDWAYQGIESIAADPVEPNRVYLAAGAYMGESGALMASDDYGETWTITEMPFSCGANCSGRGAGERMMVNPSKNSTIYFGSRTDGLWRSDDYGANWYRVESFPVKGNYSQEGNAIGVMWVEFDPGSGDVYVGVAQTDGVCIYTSSDDGASWTALPANAAGYYPTQCAISENGYLYLSYANTCGPNAEPSAGAVYRYSIAEGTYEEITPQNDPNRYGGFGGISVDAQNPDTIVTCTMGYYCTNGENIFRSTDGGVTWSAIFDGENDYYQMDVSEAQWLNWGREEASVGWWASDLEIDPFNSDVATYGTGATLYSTTNLTALGSGTDVTIAFDAKGIEETAVYEVVAPPHQSDGTTPQLYSIMGDLTGFSHLDVTVPPDDAHFMKNGDASSVDCAWQNPNIAVYTNDSKRQPLNYTTDGGATWQTCAALPCASSGGSVAVSADGSSFIWVPADHSGNAFVTTDLGTTWYACSGLSFGAKVSADRVNPKKYYANCNGNFYVSEDGGLTFTATGALLSDGAEVVVPGDKEDHVWVVSGSQIQRSTDGGKTFTPIKSLTAKCIGFGASEKAGGDPVVYAIGADLNNVSGIYRSTDLGESWQRINDDDHDFGNLNSCITGDASVYGRVYFTVNGRGIVMGDIAE